MEKLKKSNTTFIMSVAFMLALICSLMLPTTIAWFTNYATGGGEATINFGTVKVGIGDSGIVNEGIQKSFRNILPGDTLSVNIEIFNDGGDSAADMYIMPQVDVKFYYVENPGTETEEKTEITRLLTKYLTLTETVAGATALGGTNNLVYVLNSNQTSGSGVKLKGSFKFDNTLGESVSNGDDMFYLSSGWARIEAVFDIRVAAVQKNNNPDTATQIANQLASSIKPEASTVEYKLSGEALLNKKTNQTILATPTINDAGNNLKAYVFEECGKVKLLVASHNCEEVVNGDGLFKGVYKTLEDGTEITYEQAIEVIEFYGTDIATNGDSGVVKKIGNKFTHYMDLETIIVGENVTHFGKYAIQEHSNLKELVFKANDPADLTFAESETGKNNGVFNVFGVKNLCIPKNIVEIQPAAFGDLANIETVKVATGNEGGYYSENNAIMQGTGENKAIVAGFWNSTIPDDTVIIGERAFSFCSRLTNINIPSSVKTVGGAAFLSSGLLSISLPNSIDKFEAITDDSHGVAYTFQNCFYLKEVVLGDTLGYRMFRRCYALETINFGSVEAVPYECFRDCTSLKELYIGGTVKNITNGAFMDCINLTKVTMGNSMQSVGNNIFKGCVSLKEVEFGKNVTLLGNNAFEGCTSLSYINIGGKVASVGQYAFKDCTGLTSVDIGDYVVTVNAKAFYGCTNLTTVNFGSAITTINENVFGTSSEGKCEKITKIYFEDISNLTTIKTGGLPLVPFNLDLGYSTTVNTGLFNKNKNIKTLNAPYVMTIGNNSFASCTNLISVNAPYVITFGASAFVECTSLTSVSAPYVITIDANAFNGCSNLKTFDWGNSLTTIGNRAFISSGIEKAIFPASLKTIKGAAFNGCTSLTEISLSSAVNFEQDSSTKEFYTFAVCTSLSKIVLNSNNAAINLTYLEGVDKPDGKNANIFGWSSKKLPINTIEITKNVTNLTCYENLINRFTTTTDYEKLAYTISITNLVWGASLPSSALNATLRAQITEVELPESVNVSSNFKFTDFENLKVAKIGSWHSNSITNAAFGGTSSSVTDLYIYQTSGIKQIPATGFNGMQNLKNIHIDLGSNGVVGVSAFSNSVNIETIYVNCKTIERYAFQHLVNAKYAILGEDVSSIEGSWTFQGLGYNLGSGGDTTGGKIYIHANNATELGASGEWRMFTKQTSVYPQVTKIFNIPVYCNGEWYMDEYGIIYYKNKDGSVSFIGEDDYPYKYVEYLESSGTQWIDTGFKPNNNTRIECYGKQIDLTDNSIVGANPYFVITSYNEKYRFRYNNQVVDTTISSSTLSLLVLDKNIAYINGTKVGEFTSATFSSPNNALLFARASSSGSLEECAASTIYNVKIYDNGTLIRDYIPCINSSGVAGLYDKVNGVFYTNQGTGSFTTGPVITFSN